MSDGIPKAKVSVAGHIRTMYQTNSVAGPLVLIRMPNDEPCPALQMTANDAKKLAAMLIQSALQAEGYTALTMPTEVMIPIAPVNPIG